MIESSRIVKKVAPWDLSPPTRRGFTASRKTGNFLNPILNHHSSPFTERGILGIWVNSWLTGHGPILNNKLRNCKPDPKAFLRRLMQLSRFQQRDEGSLRRLWSHRAPQSRRRSDRWCSYIFALKEDYGISLCLHVKGAFRNQRLLTGPLLFLSFRSTYLTPKLRIRNVPLQLSQ